MAFPGGITGQAPGRTHDHMRWFKAARVGPRGIRLQGMCFSPYQERYYGPYLNGVYRGPTVYHNFRQPMDEVRVSDIGQAKVRAVYEDFGRWPYLPSNREPNTRVLADEATISDRISLTWNPPSSFTSTNGEVSTGRGDTQLTAFTVTGMIRNVNVSGVPDIPTRGNLAYSIHTEGGVHTVRFWKDALLVAEGSRTGDGAVSCTAQNSSGLTVACTITYTGDVQQGDAFITLLWPESYQVHYSTSALAFPRTPEATVQDIGRDDFAYVTPSLAANTYNVAIVPVRDGVAQSSGISSEAVTLNSVPNPPTELDATGTAGNITVTWTLGTAGSTYTVYYSLVDEAVNFGTFASPTPIVTAADASSQALTLAGYPGIYRVIVRATKSGIQELNDVELRIELDSNGDVVAVRPNRASIYAIGLSGLDLTIKANVLSSENEVAATDLNLYVKDVASGDWVDADFVTPEQTVALSAAVNGVQRGTLPTHTVLSAGWYRIAVRAESAENVLSYAYADRFVYLSATAPGGVSNLSVKALRGDRG